MSPRLAPRRLAFLAFSAVAATVFLSCQFAFGQSGHVLDGVGPVDQSMGGATTALPLDAIGAVHRNPASILGLPCSELAIGMGIFAPSTELNSTAVTPGGTSSGSTGSDIDISPLPSMGFVQKSDDGLWAFGFGGFAVAGFGVDFPDEPGNPINSPQFFGGIYSSFQMLQITVPVACQLTDRIAIGFAPTVDWASLGVTPFPATTPDLVPGPGPPIGPAVIPVYPDGAREDARWGLGFQVGVFFEDPDSGWNLGFNYASPQWFQEFKINSRSPAGLPRQIQFNLDYPAMFALGAAYTGFQRWDFSCDLRYIDYENTDGFQDARFAPDLSVTGFGWKSIWAVSLGTQYHVCDHFKVRMGYTWNESPVNSENMFFNVAAPAIVKNHLSTGFSWQTRWDWIFSFAYHVGFENSVEGPIQLPGLLPGSEVGADLSTHTVVGSIAKRF